MILHDEVLLTGFITIAVSIQVVGAIALAVAIDYLYFKDKIKKD